jgi:ribosomal protein S18 acetylase RimI-like enzyme
MIGTNLMDITYRLAAIADIEMLLSYMRELYEQDHLEFDEFATCSALKQIIQDDSLGRVWLIQAEDEPIGYIVLTLGYSLEYQGRDAFVDELYLHPDYRRQGIGTKSLQFVEFICQSLKVQALHLEVNRDNIEAQQFYRKLGYEDHDRYLLTKTI